MRAVIEDRYQPPEIVLDIVKQILADRMLHEMIEVAVRYNEKFDIDVSLLLRGSSGHVVMEPKIEVRR